MRASLLAAFRVAGLALALVLQLAWLVQPLPPAMKILPASLGVVSAVHPATGLIALAGLGPMANAMSLWAQSPLPGIRLLEQLVLAFVFGAGLRWWRTADSRLREAAALLAASAIASFIAVQPALLLQRAPDVSAWGHVRAQLWRGEYFLRSDLWDPLFFAALTIEGLALAVTTERIVRRKTDTAVSTIRMAVIGHAGVAALNFQQVIGAAIRGGDTWRELPRILRDVRVSLFYDVNAAGSVFLLILLSGAGLLKAATRIRWEMAALLAVVGLGLWLAGSRAALLALAVTLVGMLGVTVWTTRGAVRWVAAAAIAATLAVGSLAALLYPKARNVSIGPAAATRGIMAQTSVNMWRSAPVFGIGIGRFYEESARFGADALLRAGIGTANENAHNYFLQMLATEGAVGLGALMIVLAVVLVPAVLSSQPTATSLRRWLAVGLAAYLLTWLTGHPQLVPEASFAFWLILGVLAGLTTPAVGILWRFLLAVAAMTVLVTAPFRAAHNVRQADLEHVAVGLSHWQPEIDGLRYRLAGQSFTLYLPADGTAVDLPLRRAPGAPDPLVVSISAGGHKLYEPLLSGETWQRIRVQLPRTNRRFVRVDVEVRPAQAREESLPSPVVYVGKTERR
ncbi:MAG TPA: O-antigen ligase family protein [Vicinamibacterales bacterium]